MKKLLQLNLFLAVFFFSSSKLSSQCLITATTGLHGYGCGFGDQIDTYVLDGIAASNSGCSPNSYNFYSTPVWNLTIGNTYTWSSTTGGGSYNQGFAIWIDLNNDGSFTSNEQLGNSPSAMAHTGTFTIPFTAVPGANIRMRLRCDYATNIGNTNTTACEIYGGPNYNFYYGETEDYNVNLISPTPCTSAPGANSVITPTYAICPNSSAFLGLANTYTVGGLTYAWSSSTISPVGPFTSITAPSAGNISVPNLTVSTYFQVVITCTNTMGTATASAGQVTVQPIITDVVPYYEGFEGIPANNVLPNCSWAASNLQATCLTYTTSGTNGRVARTGSSFASFYYNPSGTNYFYTNGIQLNAGVTYSAALWYQTEYYGYNTWTDLSIMYGTTQTPTGLVTIASTNGPAISNVYKSLSNTFTVATSGIYYVAIKSAASSNCCAYYLSWDDLSITVPCTATSPNTPSVTLTAGTTTICSGDPLNLSVSGADTYTWNTGSNATSIVETPAAGTAYYTVVGTNTASGCTNTVSQTILVNPSPVVYIVASKQVVCSGSPVLLQGLGASTYTWSNGTIAQNITVNPTAPTTYTALASDANGCIGVATQVVGVNSLPTVSATTSRPDVMCPTETATLTATGNGVTFSWVSNVSQALLSGNPVHVSPSATSVYTVTATDANGCQKSTTVAQSVVNCTGISEKTILSGLAVYPNPTLGELSIETTNTLAKSIEVIDVTGKIVHTSTSSMEVVTLNLKDFSNGVYYVKIQSNNSVEVVKVVKQ